MQAGDCVDGFRCNTGGSNDEYRTYPNDLKCSALTWDGATPTTCNNGKRCFGGIVGTLVDDTTDGPCLTDPPATTCAGTTVKVNRPVDGVRGNNWSFNLCFLVSEQILCF